MSNAVELAAVIDVAKGDTRVQRNIDRSSSPHGGTQSDAINHPVTIEYTTDEDDIQYTTICDERKDEYEYKNNSNNQKQNNAPGITPMKLFGVENNDENGTGKNINASNTFGYNVYNISQIVKKESIMPIFTIISSFSCNAVCFVSLFIFILCIFLSVVCILYGFGQITQLELTNYWCNKKDLETIYQNSFENDLNQGTNDGCWKSKKFTVDEEALFDDSKSYKTTIDISKWNTIRSSVWFFYSIWFLLLAICFILVYCVDFFKICNQYTKSTTNPEKDIAMIMESNLPPPQPNSRKGQVKGSGSKNKSSFHRCCPCMSFCARILFFCFGCCIHWCVRLCTRYIWCLTGCCCLKKDNKFLEHIGDLYWKYNDWYTIRFGEDTRNWFILLITREIGEIMFQTVALLNYNGLNVFDTNDLVLAYKPFAVLLFSSLLGLNGIVVGILWIWYVMNQNLCRGLFFKQLIFVIDTMFDTFYALFPIAAVITQTGFNIEVAVGVLQTSNMYVTCIQFVIQVEYIYCPVFWCFDNNKLF